MSPQLHVDQNLSLSMLAVIVAADASPRGFIDAKKVDANIHQKSFQDATGYAGCAVPPRPIPNKV